MKLLPLCVTMPPRIFFAWGRVLVELVDVALLLGGVDVPALDPRRRANPRRGR